MIDYLDMIKADAFVRFSYEFEYDGVLQGPTSGTDNGPMDYGEDPWPFDSLYIEASDSGGFLSPDIRKTLLTFENRGHILPMEWAITRTIYDDLTGDPVSTSNHTLTLVTTATFTCETSGANTHAEFTATFKSPV